MDLYGKLSHPVCNEGEENHAEISNHSCGVAMLGGCSAAARDVDQADLARPDAVADRAAIEALEADWTGAFLTRNYARLEQLVAPEFRLVGWGDGALRMTERPAWMANARMFDFKVYETKVLDVVVVDNTAVASGNWTVGIGDKVRPNTKFLVTDTWVRRGGRWQVILRSAQSI